MTTKSRFDKPPLRIFAGYFRPHWKLFAADMCCASLIAGVDLAFPMMTKFTIERLLPSGRFGFFFVMTGMMLLIYLLRMGFTYFVTYWGHTVGAYIEADMRRDLFIHLQRLSFSFYDSNRTGQIMARVTTDLFDITEFAHHGPEDLFISSIVFAGTFILVCTINTEMALVLLVMIPLLALHTVVSRRNLMRASRRVKERTAEITATLESSISGARTAKAFTNEPYETRKFRGGNEQYKNARKYYFKIMALFHSRMDFMTHIISAVVIAAGGFLIMRDRLTLAELITCSLFVAAFLQPVRRLQNFVEQFSSGMAGFNRFVEVMRIEPDIQDRPGALVLDRVRGNVEFRDLSFAYNRRTRGGDGVEAEGSGGRLILSHINFSIPAGSTCALVGPSGGGKTTLCHLLPRFYEIREGSITIDGHDIRDVTVESLRRNIGIVQQDVFLFAGTLRENIGYGRIGATETEIIEAAKWAEIHEDIEKMPLGYDTIAGERGITLSGGQKQRISIARIFLKNPPILILDEATSALDSATEIKIRRALEELARGRTTLVIAHRLSTIRNADKIIVLDDEGIRQEGTHEELLRAGGLYAELHRAQFNTD